MTTSLATPDIIQELQELRKRIYALEQGRKVSYTSGGDSGVPNFPGGIQIGDAAPIFVDEDVPQPTGVTTGWGSFFDVIFVDVSWTAPAGTPGQQVVEYEVELTKQGEGVSQIRRTAGTSVRFEPLEADTTYSVRVRSINRLGASSSYTTAVNQLTGKDSTTPAQVSGLALGAGLRTVTASWTENTEQDMKNGHGLYEVDIALDSGFTSGLQTRRISATVVSFGDRSANTQYFVRVRAIDSSGNFGPYSTTANTTTAAVLTTDAPAPSVPTALTLTPGVVANTDRAFVTVDWTQSGTVAYWEIRFRRSGESTYEYRQTTTKPYRIEDLIPGTVYNVGVRAISPTGSTSAFTADTNVTASTDSTAPGQVTGLAIGAGLRSVTASWTDVGVADLDYYEVDIALNSIFTSGLQTRRTKATVVSFGDRSAQTQYFVRVRAVDTSSNVGTYSSTANATTAAVANADVVVGSLSGDRIAVDSLIANRIAAGTIGAHTIVLGSASSILKSSNYSAGSAGWQIDGGGDAEFNNVTVRGTIGASTINAAVSIGTSQVKLDGVNSKITIVDTQGTPVTRVEIGKLGAGTTDYGLIVRNSSGAVMFSATSGGVSADGIQTDAVTESKVLANAITALKIKAGEINSDHIITAGLDAQVIKFGTMSGDRITANTLDVVAIKTSSITAATITLASSGILRMGRSSAPFHYLLQDANGIRFFKDGASAFTGGTLTAELNVSTGSATFKGVIDGSTYLSSAASAGVAWSSIAGTWGISSNQANLQADNADGRAVLNSGISDGLFTVKIKLSATSNRADTGLIFRSNSAGTVLLLVQLGKTGTGINDRIRLRKRASDNTYTQLATLDSAGLVNGTTYEVSIVTSVDKIEIYVDKVLKLQHTLSAGDQTTYGAQTYVGLRSDRGASADDGGSRWDDLSVSGLAGIGVADNFNRADAAVLGTSTSAAAMTLNNDGLLFKDVAAGNAIRLASHSGSGIFTGLIDGGIVRGGSVTGSQISLGSGDIRLRDTNPKGIILKGFDVDQYDTARAIRWVRSNDDGVELAALSFFDVGTKWLRIETKVGTKSIIELNNNGKISFFADSFEIFPSAGGNLSFAVTSGNARKGGKGGYIYYDQSAQLNVFFQEEGSTVNVVSGNTVVTHGQGSSCANWSRHFGSHDGTSHSNIVSRSMWHRNDANGSRCVIFTDPTQDLVIEIGVIGA